MYVEIYPQCSFSNKKSYVHIKIEEKKKPEGIKLISFLTDYNLRCISIS